MSRKTDPHMDIVKLEDKETKLKSFIGMMVGQGPTGSGLEAAPILLIARSPESPVAKAIAALVADGRVGQPIRTIYAFCEPAQVADAARTLQETTIRFARDPRLHDAHEQLILGPSASWIGDCMRRDPMKRDAYECYAGDCSRTSTWARISFERMWAISEVAPEEPVAALPSDLEVACLAGPAGEDQASETSGSQSN